MAMVFAAMMMMVGSFSAFSSYTCHHAEIYCTTLGPYAIETQEVLVTNTVLVCGETGAERFGMLIDWHDIICGGNHTL